MVLEAEEEESEEELDDDVEFMECDGRWWGVRLGPVSPAVLLVIGRVRWVTGWPYHLAASVAHRQSARVTCLVRQWIHGLRQFLELMPYFFLREGELGS